MQITTRAIALAVALLASAPLLAASSGTSTAGTGASTQDTQVATEQDDCTLSALSSTNLPAGLAGLLPKPGMPDTANVNRGPGKAVSCGRPFSLRWNDAPQDSASPKLGFSLAAMPAGSGTTWPRQGSFLEDPRGADDSVAQIPF